MEQLFRKLMHCDNPPPNNRKYSSNFLALHIIKVQFALNKFKSCDRFFKVFDKNQGEGFEMTSLPKAWRVNVAYYMGRYFMYNSDFEMAR